MHKSQQNFIYVYFHLISTQTDLYVHFQHPWKLCSHAFIISTPFTEVITILSFIAIDWLALSLSNIIFLRFIHFGECISNLFFFYCHAICHFVSVCFMDIWVVLSFCLLWIKLLWSLFVDACTSFFWVHLSVEYLDPRKCAQISKAIEQFYTPPQQCRVQIAVHSCQYFIFSLFLILGILVDV